MEVDNRENSEGPNEDRPLISIVTVVFRDRAELEKIARSVERFRGDRLELIVVDGGSSDGTVNFLLSNPGLVDYWRSESDHGVYDAMNKGLRAARGVYVLHINAGDRLLHIPWEALEVCAQREIDVVSCRVLMDAQEKFRPRTSFTSRIDNTWHHQGTFYRRAAHLGYDVSFAICGDFEHNQRLLRLGCSVRHLPDLVARHRSHGLSAQKSARSEIYRSIRRHYGLSYIIIAALRFQLAPLWLWLKHRRLRSAGT